MNNSLTPVPFDKHIDRLYHTRSLSSYNSNDILRIKTVLNNGKEIISLNQKKIPLDFEEIDPNKDVYRIKAKLSMAIDGVKESHWLTQKHHEFQNIESINQFRVRGVSSQKDRSDWVYTNIKDEENNSILFELLHDLLEVMLTANDENLEYTIDQVIEDIVQNTISEQKIRALKYFGDKENLQLALTEFSVLLDSALKNSVEEKIIQSTSEFFELLKTYNVMDRYEEEQTDFITLLLESLIEDQIDDILTDIKYEVIMQGKDNIHILFDSAFSFDIKASLIQSLYSLEINDYYISTFNDVVQLISEPIVQENIDYKNDESYFNLFKKMIKEIYMPLLVLDKQSISLGTDFEDEFQADIESKPIRYDLFSNDEEVQNWLYHDFMELILNEVNKPLQEITISLLDHILTPRMEVSLKLWIYYSPVEMLAFVSQVNENIRHQNTKEKSYFQFNKNVSLNEMLASNNIKNNLSVDYTLANWIHEINQIHLTYKQENIEEVILLKLVENALNRNTVEDNYINNTVKFEMNDIVVLLQAMRKDIQEISSLLSYESISLDNSQVDNRIIERIKTDLTSDYFNLYRHFLDDLHTTTKKDYSESIVQPFLKDNYLLLDEEDIHFTFDNVGGDFPIGKFILGVNTLQSKK